MMPAKIRRMSKRRQKIALRRKLSDLLRGQLDRFVGQRLSVETLQRMQCALAEMMASLCQSVKVVSAKLQGDMLSITIAPVPPVAFINVTQTVGGPVPDRLTFAGTHAVGGHSGHGGGLD